MNKNTLLDIAKKSIAHGLEHGNPLAVKLQDFPQELQEIRATFVTLHLQQQLRGCIGMLEALRPLVVDVAENAYAAAFQDSRFEPVSPQEFPLLEISISILSVPIRMHFESEEALLQQIRVGVDGLILSEGRRRGTFLPSVWEQISNAKEFLTQLKFKAGLPQNYWSSSLTVHRYTVEEIR
ncbi:MAG: AmmeMemoRadiSam system protein A [Deltaproteobacteria bacterium]|nr:AmmeMemoRadiSam system protein A [Deltaproteobacteria bacterium]